jgi:hypothetical protein
MNHYGQSISWSTINAPRLFTGICTAYSYRDALTHQLISDEGGDHVALALHSRKAEIEFEARVTSESGDFLNLNGGAAITVAGITGGVVLATRAVERWALGQPKTAAITATHFPSMIMGGGDPAKIDFDAFTPTQTLGNLVSPGSTIIYGTNGLNMDSVGVIHRLSIEQRLSLTEDEPSPEGTIPGAATHGYLRTIQLDILAKGAIPEVGTSLSIDSALPHAADYRVERAEVRFAEQRGKMYSISAVWIPPFTEVEP